METLVPEVLLLAQVLRRNLETGRSTRKALEIYIDTYRSPWARQIQQFLFCWDEKKDLKEALLPKMTLHQRALLELCWMALRGGSIYERLLEVEKELHIACEEEILRKTSQLPFLLMIPLLFFQLPAFLLLLFGPILKTFMEAF